MDRKSCDKPARTRKRGWLRRGPGIPLPADGALLALVCAGSSIPEELVRKDLTAAMLADLPFWAWIATDGCGWSPYLFYSLQAGRALQSAIARRVLVRDLIDYPVSSRKCTLERLHAAISSLFRPSVPAVQERARTRPEREAEAIVEALHF